MHSTAKMEFLRKRVGQQWYPNQLYGSPPLSVRENTCSGNVTETGNISALPDLFPRWQHQHTV